jgi:hypothetical protein
MHKHISLIALAVAAFPPVAGAGSATFEADRRAILSMAGQFAVKFSFRETLSLQPGYTAKPGAYDEDAHELVVVAEDSGRRIRLQHLLVDDGHVIKHWAQIWTYEDTRVCEFQGHNEWKLHNLDAGNIQGTWTQQVTQVDDSPRYESWGRWEHTGGVSQWTSQDTWRPLPRREHTKRKDYDVISGTNRHVITPDGWAHEQDNTKLIVRDGETKPLVRESGLNTYRRVTDADFTAAHALWEKDGGFWNAVVAAWEDVQQARPQFAIYDRFDVPALRRAVDEVRTDRQGDVKDRLRAVIEAKLAPAATVR